MPMCGPVNWVERMAGHLDEYDAVGGPFLNGTPESVTGTLGYCLEFFRALPKKTLDTDARCLTGGNSGYRQEAIRDKKFMSGIGEDIAFNFELVREGRRVLYDPSLGVLHLNRVGFKKVFEYHVALGRGGYRYRRKLNFRSLIMRAPMLSFLVPPAIVPFIGFKLFTNRSYRDAFLLLTSPAPGGANLFVLGLWILPGIARCPRAPGSATLNLHGSRSGGGRAALSPRTDAVSSWNPPSGRARFVKPGEGLYRGKASAGRRRRNVGHGEVRARPKELILFSLNPHKGFCTFQRFNGDPLYPGAQWSEAGPRELPRTGSDVAEGYLPTTVAYCRWFWETVEPEEGRLDFTVVEKALETARQRGQTLHVRLMPTEPRTRPMPRCGFSRTTRHGFPSVSKSLTAFRSTTVLSSSSYGGGLSASSARASTGIRRWTAWTCRSSGRGVKATVNVPTRRRTECPGSMPQRTRSRPVSP